MSDLAHHMETVARALLGEPNAALSTSKKLLYGTRGSLAIDVEKGVWHDHEHGEGGGVLDLIRRETTLTNGAAFDWLREHGIDVGAAKGGTGRQIVATYPYQDEQGGLLFEVVRFAPKDFRQRRPDPSNRVGGRGSSAAPGACSTGSRSCSRPQRALWCSSAKARRTSTVWWRRA